MDYKTAVSCTRSAFIGIGLIFIQSVFQDANAQCTSTFSISPNDTICIGETLVLTDLSFSTNGIGGWAWSANGSQLAGSPVSSFSTQFEGVYTIQLQAFDNLGTACDVANQTVVVLGNPVVELTSSPISCYGACDGGMSVTYTSDNEGAYTATWAGVGGSTALSGLCPGVYTAVVTDDYGCTTPFYSVQEQLYQSGPLQAIVTNGQTIMACPGNPSVQIELQIEGGTPFPTQQYSVSWSPATGLSNSNVEDPTLTPLSTNLNQVYTATITDFHGCQTNSSFEHLADVSRLQGNVTVGSDPCVACEVMVYTNQSTAWNQIKYVTTNVSGNYSIDSIPGETGIYIMVDPDNVFYPTALETYYGSPTHSHRWTEALQINSGCQALLNKDIQAITTPPQNGGCTMSGTLYYSHSGKVQQEDPIPLIDVVVEKTPPGTPVGKSTTNVNGEFEFNLMEASQSNYVIYVNIAGIPMGQTYEVTIDQGDLLFDQLNLCLNEDSTEIAVCAVSSVEDSPESTRLESFAFPNPNNGNFTLSMGKFEGSAVEVQVLDLSGRLVSNQSFGNAPNQLTFSGFSEGYYLVRLRSSDSYQILRLNVIQN